MEIGKYCNNIGQNISMTIYYYIEISKYAAQNWIMTTNLEKRLLLIALFL